ncbi:MAG: SDR family NAD(P)-dependent oxidoreductase [Bacteroidota bacterium]
MKNKNILLTGGHSGMGLELTKMLLNEGHKIGLIVRNEKRKNDAREELGNTPQIDFFFADLSKREDIERVSDDIKTVWTKIDVIFNNAGVLLDKLYFSNYGNELQLEINALSPYLFTKELLPLLEKAQNPLIVNTATTGLQNKKSIDIPSFKKPKKFTKLTGAYIDSKLTMVLLMNYLNSKNENLRVINVDPGAIKTKMTAGDGMPIWLKPIRNLLFKSPKEGAQQLYEAAFDSKHSGKGLYISKGKVKKMQVVLSENELDVLLK